MKRYAQPYSLTKKFFLYIILPLLFYFAAFFLLSYPLMLSFNTHILGGVGDALQNYWNIWWVNKAITQLHTNPFYTNYLFFPYGVTLIGHTLNIFNGLIAIPLLTVFSLAQTYNVIIITSFVLSGLTMFFLAFYLSKKYAASLLAGYIFTFSEYHFSHAVGHMQLVSTEWLPVFVLSFYIFLKKPTLLKSIVSAFALFLVLLCDYYYFFYCILISFVLFVWSYYKNSSKNIFKWSALTPYLTFTLACLCLCGPIVFNLFFLNIIDPFLGAHPSSEYSLDLFALFIPGEFWRFSHLSYNYWIHLPGNVVEHSVYIGWSVIIVLSYVFINRSHYKDAPLLRESYVMISVFFLLALGPTLHIIGHEFKTIPIMPYGVLCRIFPFVELSGVPVRMSVVITLFIAIIFAFGIDNFFHKNIKVFFLGSILLIVLFLEYLPGPITTTRITTPEYVNVLKELQGNDGVIDLIRYEEGDERALYFQTIYDKPRVSGYISRVPKSIQEKNDKLLESLAHKNYRNFYKNYGIRYVVSNTLHLDCKSYPVEKNVSIYDLKFCN